LPPNLLVFSQDLFLRVQLWNTRMVQRNQFPLIVEAGRTRGTRFSIGRVIEKLLLAVGNFNYVVFPECNLLKPAPRMLDNIERIPLLGFARVSDQLGPGIRGD